MSPGSLREEKFKPQILNFLYVWFVFLLWYRFLIVKCKSHVFRPSCKGDQESIVRNCSATADQWSFHCCVLSLI